ncbi:MAG: hypothetical protein KDA93_17020 [Planctomycetaceae bacterium]|nr:hypothetical protein [Planctomycetaceae bacterium]
MTHWFELILTDLDHVFELDSDEEFDDSVGQMANDLYDAGCDDGTFGCSNKVFKIGFAREAATLEEAVRSAISDVRKAGLQVGRVELNTPPFLESINAQLAGEAISTSM